ncbi:MAG: SufB/SufD family protein [Candidatus Limivicinus sp.]|jgi:Fe-S cluster assembly scaffold protein SufB
MSDKMNDTAKKLLKLIMDTAENFKGAYNIRQDGQCVSQVSSRNIEIVQKKDKPGINVIIKPGTKGETVYIPACVTRGGVDDLVYNDFFVGEDSDVLIVAGCGVHTDDSGEARHSGIHSFVVGENAHVRYVEKHIGTGSGSGTRSIDPVTAVTLEKNSYMEMDMTQISGVSKTVRKTSAEVAEGARLVVRERLFTEAEQHAETFFDVALNGEGSGADIVSRSVAKDRSYQSYVSTIAGNAPCTGHTECDSIIDGEAVVDASPRLLAHNKDASLIHEAAIGKIAGEQILKLRTLGLTEEEAEKKIIEGFLA